jgi:hypothetical protein
MKFLFLAHNLGKTRHFEGVIHELTRRRHSVVVTAAHKRNKPLKLGGAFSANPRVDVVSNPVRRLDHWEPFVRPLRQARDYLRFLDPSYAHAEKLAARAREYAPPGWAERFADGRMRARYPLAKRALAVAESLVPSERYYELFIRAHAPDAVLVTPLVDFGSYQTDYVKSAHRLGVPVAFLPFSWDNLTNRGLVRVAPDRVLVWNDIQKSEAIRYHDVPEDRVIVTGAPRFDEFFAMRPSTSRDEFCAQNGLDPSRPFVLYLCSSHFVAPNEVAFVREWMRAVRGSSDSCLAGAGLLVRPHPAHVDQWQETTLEDRNASIWSHPARMQGDPGLYDSLFHAAAVAGLNTSAMIEAGILGKSVHTIETAEFAGGQDQTLHFHYLLARNGGLVDVAADLTEHTRQLAGALEHPESARARGLQFIERFVRPRGLARPVAPIVADEVEEVARIRKKPRRTPLWHYPARRVLLTALRQRHPGQAK